MRRLCAAGLAVACAIACALRDPDVPWDTAQMARDLAADLRRFEGVTAPLEDVQVLAFQVTEWQYDSKPLPPAPPGINLPKQALPRGQNAVVSARTVSGGATSWILAQVFRDLRSGDPWCRTWIEAEPVKPPGHLAPGWDPTGHTWSGFQRFTRRPTAQEVCDFAAVGFLKRPILPTTTLSGGLRPRAWQAVTGEPPACTLPQIERARRD